MRRGSRVLRMVCAAQLVWAVGCGAKDSKAAAAGGPPPLPVQVTTALASDVPVDIRAIGTVESVASVVLKPQIAGVIVDIRFEEGADVRAGDPLVLFDTRPYEAALHSVEAELARDAALADDAKRAAGQIEEALQKSAVSQRSAEQARAAFAAADATVRKDQAALEMARLNLDYCTVRAPFDGRTGKLSARRGSVVKANETELVAVSRIVPIRVAFAVPQARLAEIRKAAADAPPIVRAEVPDSPAPIEGTLTFIDNSVDATSGTIGLLATFANEDRGLWPGQYVQVVLRTGVERGAVIVPLRAVQRGQKGDFVFVVGKDNAVELRLITVKRNSANSAVVSQGLSPGDVVVTDGQLRLVPGARVDPRQPAAEAQR